MTENLDEVRGVLAALADRGTALLQPVSTGAISGALRRRNRVVESGGCLDVLGQIGDVQRLRGGYWLPCPTTLVRCADMCVAVSGLPTRRLASDLGENLLTLGNSRAVPRGSIADSDIRLRAFSSWCRAPLSSIRWAEAYVARARFQPGTVTESMEWHDHWTPKIRIRWSELHRDVDLSRGIALGRLKGRHGTATYLVLRRNGGVLEMADVSMADGSHHRLRYALLAAAGNSEQYRSTPVADDLQEVEVTRVLPAPESMVLSALGRALTAPDAWDQVFQIPEAAWPQVEAMLTGLGLIRSDAA